MLRRALLVCALPALLSQGACRDSTTAPGDAGFDSYGSDGPTPDVAGALSLDFAVTGCARYDMATAACAGTPPLTVSLSPVGSAALTRFLWTFGDGTPTSSERAPTHTYVLPGMYDVSLVAGGAGGTASRTHVRFIQTTAVAVGAPCDVDGQCATGLHCLCGSNAPCGPAFPRGVCTSACPATGCGTGATCAALDVPAPGDAGAPADAQPSADAAGATHAADADAAAVFDAAPDTGTPDAPARFDAPTADAAADARDAPAAFADASDAATVDADTNASSSNGFARMLVCLATCQVDGDCATGLVCRALPTKAPSGTTWARTCVPAFYRDLGAACRDATGALDDDACATGTCANLGALGLCSASCAGGAACPSGSTCATFGNGAALCVRACDDTFTCAVDPLLDCEAPGHSGAMGFQVSPPQPTATFCAPRTCSVSMDCAPAGTCAPLGSGGHCEAP